MKAKNIFLIIALIAFASFALVYFFAESISGKNADNLERITLLIGCASTVVYNILLVIERIKSKKAVSQN